MSDYGKQTGPSEIEFTRLFDAPPETVWQFLTEPEKRKLWFCGGHTDDFVGGTIELEFDHRRISESAPPAKYASEEVATHQAEILEYDPPRRFCFTWFEGDAEGHSVVEMTLRPAGMGQTELHLVHKGLIEPQIMVGVFAGWHGHFDLLAEVVVGERKTDFWLRDQQLEAEYEQRV